VLLSFVFLHPVLSCLQAPVQSRIGPDADIPVIITLRLFIELSLLLAVFCLQAPVQSRIGPDADIPVIIPDSLVAVQAFVMWEQAGKPQVRTERYERLVTQGGVYLLGCW
jgi:hypothetical protein